MSLYGLTAVTSGASWDPNDPRAEERAIQQAADATAAEEQKRPKRLEKLVGCGPVAIQNFKAS